MLVLTL